MKNKNENKEKNPLLLLKRLLSYIVKNYKLACFMVVVCILVSALTTLCGTLFIQKLIDNYIVPLTQMAVPDYSPLAQALLKLVAIFAVGVLCSYGYNRIILLEYHHSLASVTLNSNILKCHSGIITAYKIFHH